MKNKIKKNNKVIHVEDTCVTQKEEEEPQDTTMMSFT